jgi:voltage-gated potassium channel
MALLAGVYLAVGFLTDEGKGVSPIVLGGLAAVFLAEFGARCWDSPSRYGYLKSHWIDLISAIPLVGGLRTIRILRLARLAAAGRIFTLADRQAQERSLDRQSFWYLGPLLFVVWVVAAAAYWELEHGVNPQVKTFAEALYWAFITATTVGYGDATPVTAEGRILAGLVIFIGIGLLGFASGLLTQRMLKKSQSEENLVVSRLDALDQQLAELTSLLAATTSAQTPAPNRRTESAPAGRAIAAD